MMDYEDPLKLVKFVREKPISPVWIQSFGPYPWFFVPFLGEVIARNGWIMSELYRIMTPELFRIIPRRWREFHKWGQWQSISPQQFKYAASGDLIRLDKALTSSVLVDAVVRGEVDRFGILPSILEVEFDRDLDYYFVMPSTFVIDGLERRILDDQMVREISEHSGQSMSLIRDVARGDAVCELIASDVCYSSRCIGIHNVEYRLLKDRKDYKKNKQIRPSHSQRFDRSSIIEFYDIAMPSDDD